MTTRVLVVDDNPVVRAGLVSLLGLCGDLDVCGEAGNGADALQRCRETSPDVVLLDVRMPSRDGLSVLPELIADSKVLMLTHSEESQVISQAMAAGATGYLVHGSFEGEELVTAIRDTATGRMRLSPEAAQVLARRPGVAAVEGEPSGGVSPAVADRCDLTAREVEICELMVRGLGNADIARELFIEAKTVKNHINRIFAKLGVTTRAQAIATCLSTAGTQHADPRA